MLQVDLQVKRSIYFCQYRNPCMRQITLILSGRVQYFRTVHHNLQGNTVETLVFAAVQTLRNPWTPYNGNLLLGGNSQRLHPFLWSKSRYVTVSGTRQKTEVTESHGKHGLYENAAILVSIFFLEELVGWNCQDSCLRFMGAVGVGADPRPPASFHQMHCRSRQLRHVRACSHVTKVKVTTS